MHFDDTTPEPTAPQRADRTNQLVALAVAVILLLAGVAGWWVGTQRVDNAEVSTDGPITEATADTEVDADIANPEDGSDPADDAAKDGDTSGTTTAAEGADETDGEPADPETAEIEPGTPLVFTDVTDADAPGGYNVWQNGRSNGLYYVLSTAPGVTWESINADCEDDGHGLDDCWEPLRNDTIYTYDGERWTRTTFDDRFVTHIDTASNGLLYTVSTGSPAGADVAFGSSTDTGSTWDWVSLDTDRSDDVPTRVQVAERNGEFLVIVERPGFVDWTEAGALARAAGLDVSDDRIWHVDVEGIEWEATPVDDGTPDCQAIAVEFQNANDPWTEPPHDVFDENLTEAQQDELDAHYEAQNVAFNEIERATAAHLAGIAGCEELAICMSESVDQREAVSAAEADMWAELGFGPDIDWDELTPEQNEALDAAYEALWAPYDEWFVDSGCAMVFDYDTGHDGEVTRSTWAELGVDVPDAWIGSLEAHRVVNGEATALGPVLDGRTGWVVSLDATADGWRLLIDVGQYESNLTELTSTDGADWTIESENNGWPSGGWWDQQIDADGTQWHIDWRGAEDGGSRLVRTDASGTQTMLTVNDLAATTGLNLGNYQLDNVHTGAFGTVVTASAWETESYTVDSIVFFSVDGIEWGATPIPDTYVVDTIVGDDDVLVFGERPDRVNSETPQPVLIGTAG